MKIAVITNPVFRNALSKLMAAPLPLKVAYKLHSVDKVVKEELDKYDKCRLQALEQFGKRKEDGSLDADNAGNVYFEDGKDKDFVKQLQELLDVEFEHAKIKVEEIEGKVELSGNELAALDGLLEL